MIRLAWMTDIHLNFLGTVQIENWLHTMNQSDYDKLLITGDIGEAHNIADYLIRISDYLNVPIYFVLGNHDYYRSSIAQVRAKIQNLDAEYPQLNWLPLHDIVPLNETTALIGHGGWGDAGYGDYMGSSIRLNDYQLIEELSNIDDPQRLAKLRELGHEAGQYIARVLSTALNQFEKVIVALHVPPFQESCWHEGNTPNDDDDYLPHFTCKAVGDVLLKYADDNPHHEIIVLCGHTHGSGIAQLRPNLKVITSGAEYGNPVIADIFSL